MKDEEQVPSVDERKAFWLWSHAHSAFNRVVAACEFLASPESAGLSPSVKSTIETGVIVSYCKPFKSDRGVDKLTSDCVPSEYLGLHKLIEDLRDKTIAHFDAKGFQADDPSIGNINQVRIEITDQRYDCSVLSPSVGLLDWKKVRKLAEFLRDAAKSHADRFCEKYLSPCNRRGSYKLDLEASSNWLRAFDRQNG